MGRKIETVEDVILRYTGRGMDLLRPYLAEDFCREAARRISELPRGKALLITGFYVAGVCETDGPPGTFALAEALKSNGFEPVIVTDTICDDYFEPFGFRSVYLGKNMDKEAYRELFDREDPVLLISIERCGRTADGDYANCRGISIAQHTARADELFEIASEKGVYTVGIGDGGNEIGMGLLAPQIAEKLALKPCVTKTSSLIIATTSNWGAYGLATLIGGCPDLARINEFTAHIVSLGSVDGVSHKPQPTVDGFEVGINDEIVTALTAFGKEG
jgi:hypothetical protein